MTKLLLCLLLVLPVTSLAKSPSELDLASIMADPSWIGDSLEAAWWAPDGASIVFRRRLPEGGSESLRLGLDARETMPLVVHDGHGEGRVWNTGRTHQLHLLDGDLFVTAADGGGLRQLTRLADAVLEYRFAADGRTVHLRTDEGWWRTDIDGAALEPWARVRFEEDPFAPPKDLLARESLRLSQHLQRERTRRITPALSDQGLRRELERRAAPPLRLDAELSAEGVHPSPNGHHVLIVTRPKSADGGQRGAMPRHVTETGYEDSVPVRTRVGRVAPPAHGLWLGDLRDGSVKPIELGGLPGSHDRIDVTAVIGALRPQPARRRVEQGPMRAIRVVAVRWNPSGSRAAIMLRSVDNKDRWIASWQLDSGLEPVHRLQDPAWINWAFNEFGWIDDESLWLQSEESGYGHIYRLDLPNRRIRPLTSGDWEASEPIVAGQGQYVYFIGNREAPWRYELYRVDLRRPDETLERLTGLFGVESFLLSPDERRVLLRHSEPYRPAQLSVLDLATRELVHLYDSASEAWRRYAWPKLEIVAIPSSQSPQPIWSKLYLPDRTRYPGPRPAVIFVHGAGYLQNTHYRWPQYFREQLFHLLLVEHGFVVLDPDFRASRGYGRDWRTAIYRQMGTPELEDLRDGLEWLVREHQVDPDRVGVYGGSYGGFVTLMAMFREPGLFQAGAALRPVTDWRHYSHPYTSNILNEPEADPEAYARSSPIEFAEGLAGHLLISHGMLDDNVFFQDSLRLVQRLIELRKANWELASYPLENHGFVQPESWYDQYRRIFELFSRVLAVPYDASPTDMRPCR